jgi:hypothetical protein
MKYVDILGKFDVSFAKDTSSMVSFPNSVDVGLTVFAGLHYSTRSRLLSQLSNKFKLPLESPQLSNRVFDHPKFET